MMKRWIVLMPVVAFSLVIGAAVFGPLVTMPASAQMGPNVKYQAVSATQVNTNVDFGFRATHLLLINDGANEVYVELGGTTATTSDFELKAGENFTIDVPPMEDIGLICAAGEMATVRVLATSG